MLTEAVFKFALESLKKYMMMEPKNNVFFSPLLVYQNLLMIYFGANGDFENLLKQVLCISADVPKAAVMQYYFNNVVQKFSYAMGNPETSCICRIYNKIWVSDKKEIKPEIIDFFVRSQKAQFDSNRTTFLNNLISNIAKSITQRFMRNLSLNIFNTDTEVVLFNAIYCKGQLDRSSHLDATDGCSTHENIKTKSDELNAYIMKVPCIKKEISTFFLFPSEYYELDQDSSTRSDIIMQLVERMTTEEGSRELYKLLNDEIFQQTDIEFPIFEIEQDLRMYELLDFLGLQELTPLGTAYLHDFATTSLKINDAKHRISIKMTKNDITVAAYTVFFTNNSYEPEPNYTTATNVCFPCVCLIYDKIHKNILFCGVLLEDIKESES